MTSKNQSRADIAYHERSAVDANAQVSYEPKPLPTRNSQELKGRSRAISMLQKHGKANSTALMNLSKDRTHEGLTKAPLNLVAQAQSRSSSRAQLQKLRPKSRKLGLMPVGRAKFDAVPIATMISLSNQLGAELGLRVEAAQYPGSTASAPATELFCKDLWTLQALALWVTDGLCYADQFPSMKNIVTKKGHKPNDISPLISASGHALFDLSSLLGNEVWGPDGIYGRQADSVLLSFNRFKFKTADYGVFDTQIQTSTSTHAIALETVLDRLFEGVFSTKISTSSLEAGPVAVPAACDELSTAAAAAAEGCEVRKDTSTGAERKPYQGEDLLGSRDGELGSPKASTKFPWGWVIGGAVLIGGATWYFWPESDE